jgi:preprotein translocase subunit YajC
MIESLQIGIQRLMVLAGDLGPGFPLGVDPTPGAGGEIAPPVVAPGSGYVPVADAPVGGFSWWWIVLYGAVFVGMYFLMIRPQRKREKAMKELQSSIKTGDNIVTTGGLFGRVSDVGTDCFVVEFGIGGRSVRMPVLKSDVLGVRDPVLTPPPVKLEKGSD